LASPPFFALLCQIVAVCCLRANYTRHLLKRSQKLAKKLSITQETVFKGLLEAYEMARDKQESMGMIAACREIGRLCGYYAPERKQVGVFDNRLMAQLRDMSEAELLEITGGEGHPGHLDTALCDAVLRCPSRN
jgi:hypothetical protein